MADKYNPKVIDDSSFNKEIDYLPYKSYQKSDAGIYQPLYILDQPFPNKTVYNELYGGHELITQSTSSSPSRSGSRSPSASPSRSPYEQLTKFYEIFDPVSYGTGIIANYDYETNPIFETYYKHGCLIKFLENVSLSYVAIHRIQVYSVGGVTGQTSSSRLYWDILGDGFLPLLDRKIINLWDISSQYSEYVIDYSDNPFIFEANKLYCITLDLDHIDDTIVRFGTHARSGMWHDPMGVPLMHYYSTPTEDWYGVEWTKRDPYWHIPGITQDSTRFICMDFWGMCTYGL